ncbi:MAG: class I SAM-dependent methyltransferase [Spirochaetota bacterium]
MTHAGQIESFIEYDCEHSFIIEPALRREHVKKRLLAAVKAHSPKIAVKIGIGEGDIALALADKVKRLVVIDPSLPALERFKKKYGAEKAAEKIDLVNGSFSSLPVDYFKADMIVCIDYLDLADSYRTVDEIRRALRYEGFFFFGGVVLHDGDVEGTYDEFIHSAHPLHNDYYLESDLNTFMKLKDFTLIDSHVETHDLSAGEYLSYWGSFPSRSEPLDEAAARKVLFDNSGIFSSLYSYDGKNRIRERYMTAVFRKNEYKNEEKPI